MTSAKVEPRASSKERAEKIIAKNSLLEFGTHFEKDGLTHINYCGVRKVFHSDSRYVVAQVQTESVKSYQLDNTPQTDHQCWLVNFEDECAQYLPIDLSTYDTPVIVKIGLEFNSGGTPVRVNFAISDRRYKLRDDQLTSGLDIGIPKEQKEYDVSYILELIEENYDLRSVNVKSNN